MKGFVLRVLILPILVVAAGLGLWSCSPGGDSRKVGINFGTVPTAATALIYIALDRGFFSANGLSVNIRDYATGIATTDALLKGDTDISWVAEFPFVRRAFEKANISIIAVVDRFNEQYIFGRKDRGIQSVADLKGKTIGIPRNTIAEFYLGRFLELNGMTMQDVTIVDVAPQQSVDTVMSGRVDGVIVWEPYSSQIRVKLADKGVALPVQSGQPGYGAIVARNDWIKRHSEVVTRFLKSLVQAEDYLIRNPAGVKAILRKSLNYDDVFTEIIWSENQISLSLDQSLIAAMEDEARWMIKNGLTTEKDVPDFLSCLYLDGLTAIKPEAVRIIR